MGSRLLPANWRVRPRLVALILLPTAAAVLLSGLQLTTALSTAGEYRRMTEVASLVESLGTLSHEMAEERDLTAWYVAGGTRARLTRVRDQRLVVDRTGEQVSLAIDALEQSQAARVRSEAAQVKRWLDGLPGLRRLMTDGSVLPRAALGMYSRMIGDFITLHDDLGRSGGDERLIGDALALGALSRAKEQVARQRGTLLVSFLDRKFDFDDPADLLGAYRSQQSEENAFRATAAAGQIQQFGTVVGGTQAIQANTMRTLVMSLMRENKPLERIGPSWLRSAEVWYNAASAEVDGMRTVERGLSAAVVARSRALESAEQRNAIVSGASILVLLVLILFITAWVAGTLVRPLRKLRSEALEVAGNRLPETVRVLRESGDHAPDVEVPSIGVSSRDEIGEVARAFDEVHREAIRLAGDEARLRSNINSMFVNLSRRTQSLVERQIDLIDDLEQGEQDEGRLGSLFKLDHLATRMRRNSENLLVLAGQEQSRRWSEPVPLSDVVRASLSEVENYERVNLRVEPGTSIIGQAVNDIVHLVAELVENAIFFSPQDTKITVTSNGNEMGTVILAVTDSGIGMSDEELAEANRRLAEPPAVDLSVSRRMGLFVVGRLAMRHGIRVQLRRPDTGGLSAVVLLPAQVVAQATMTPEMAMAGQGGPPGSFGGPGVPFGSAPAADPFAAMNPDPFGTAGRSDAFGAARRPGPFGSAPGTGTFGTVPAGASGADRNQDPFAPAPGAGTFGAAQRPDPFASAPGPDPFASAPGPDPFASAPGPGAFGAAPGADPFASASDAGAFGADPFASASGAGGFGAGNGGRPSDDGGRPAPSFGQASFGQASADLWSGPTVSASAVEDMWSSPLTPAPAPSFPSTGPEHSSSEPWSARRSEPLDSTQALPAVNYSPTEPDPEEFLPIFAAVGSDWFRTAASGNGREHDAEPGTAPEPGASGEPVTEQVAGQADERIAPSGGEGRPRPLEQRVRRGPQGLETQNIPQISHSSPAAPAAPSFPESPAASLPPSLSPSSPSSPPLPRRQPRHPEQPSQAAPQAPRQPEPLAAGPADRQPWSSPSDQGWAAAETAKKPVEGGVTGAGLPKRVPKANLVPGSAPAAASAPAAPMPPVSAERVRSRLSSFQQGVRQGRAEMSERANAVEGENQQ
ncbi:nitrate- and nitrite sensing domain-containing protein [Streptosporangium sp. DT93]|uniref:sensor histidine kinase n=1 Tax=Streptosporangium sp. DT93 TaxID=3393428 RepID=UPI003CF8B396